ncbi:alkaline serine protease [Apodospora peruviana]|uniref:tripeptidyl-peptidase II n=1 Tax=Apodospora peruviana TaxID=516989 RepID=A0AAE0M045_9PEZI|nr:alkaline serine protease [Apodospora peruviana]
MILPRFAILAVSGLVLQALAASLPVHDVHAAAIKRRDIPETHVLHERGLPHWSTTWERRAKIPPKALLPMRIGLRQPNLDVGHDMLMDRSNPESPNFRRHLSAREVIDLFAPPEDSVQLVTNWVMSAGIPRERVSQSTNKQWIQFDANASDVESLLFTDYYVFEHLATGTKNVACDEYHIPGHIRGHIDYITPGIRLRADPGKVKKLKRDEQMKQLENRGVRASHTGLLPIKNALLPTLPPLNSSVCDKYVTPECIRAIYSVPEGTKASPGNELGVFESLGDHYSKQDLDDYWSNVYPKIPNGTYPIEKLIDGAFGAAQDIDQVGGESDLDFQAAWPLIWPQNTILFQTDDQYYELNQTDENTPFLGFWNTFYDALDGSYCTYSAFGETGNCVEPECLDPIYPNENPGGYKGELQCGVYEPTNVISISYGGGEADLPAYYNQRQCSEIMKLGLQGVTVVISSGDSGVGSYPGDGGFANGCAGTDNRVFYPASDATCPYVLSVGSTEFYKTHNNSNTTEIKYGERATRRFPSGGGFSNVFEAPDYQKKAVAEYFETVKLGFTGYEDAGTNFSDVGTGVYHIGGRGYPDVAAVGDAYVIRFNGTWRTIGGTSLSAPVWAAMLTLVNEERIAAGKPTVGFVNPILYSHPEIFNDVKTGSNPACNSTGFLASPGWDPVSGLGSPQYPKLLEVLMNL